MPQNSMEGQHLQDKPSWAGLGPSIPARRRLGEEIGSKHDHWLIAMRQDWRLPPLLVCIKTSGSGSGEFSGGFSGEFSGGFKGEFSGEFSGGFAGGFSGLPSSSGVSATSKIFPLNILHLQPTTHLDTFPNQIWIFWTRLTSKFQNPYSPPCSQGSHRFLDPC